MVVLATAVKVICANPTAAINARESAKSDDRANAISRTQKASVPSNMKRMLGLLLPQAIHSAEINEPSPKAAERKPKPVGPEFSTFVAKSGNTTLKLMP